MKRVILVVASFAAACTQDLSEMQPFPCAEDDTCPYGFDCARLRLDGGSGSRGDAGVAARQCVRAISCPAGKTKCDGECLDLSGDVRNCGGCQNTCAAGQACCAGACVDLRSDSDHCGHCGNACLEYLGCFDSSCACPGGAGLCGTRCIDLETDPANCGRCGNICPSGATCARGKCTCPLGRPTVCSNACVDLDSDTGHCGGCGEACKAGAVCSQGTCRCSGASQTDCPNACAELESDERNCGACGTTCKPSEECVGGRCSCVAPKQYCAGECVDTSKDLENCGVCGSVCSGACLGGSCCRREAGSSCEPVSLCGCASGENCTAFIFNGEFFFFACTEAGSASLGGSCEEQTDCARGLFCALNDGPGSAKSCHKYCATPGQSCGGGTTCSTVAIGDDEIGHGFYGCF